MAYSELIKNFSHIREYMRRFYVYGFKSRSDFGGKSLRSYDDEKRRIESWLGNYMSFTRDENGKNMFISIDSRQVRHNPLFKAMKAASFTDKDITLHFIIFDILDCPGTKLSLAQIARRIDGYLAGFENPITFDESTLRKKLKEYINLGIIKTEKQGKTLLYFRSETFDLQGLEDVTDFFSEVMPCGVIGSYISDRQVKHSGIFSFKHHYITRAMDSIVMYKILAAITQRQKIAIEYTAGSDRYKNIHQPLTPIKIYISASNGRQYLMAGSDNGNISAFRLDHIKDIRPLGLSCCFDRLAEKFSGMSQYIWGANVRNDNVLESVRFTVYFSDKEEHIYNRLLREKRCGTVTRIDQNHAEFTAGVYDSREMVPWIRSFICRIDSIEFSNKELEKSFKQDLQDMYTLYGLEG